MPDNTDDILTQIANQLLTKQTQSNPIADVGTVLGRAAEGRAAGVNAQNATALGAGDLSNRLFQSSMQRQLAQNALPNFRAQQAVTGDQIANTQDVGVNAPSWIQPHITTFTGGRRPSNLGPNARSAGAALSGIGASNIGKDVLPAVPTMPEMKDGGVLGDILGGGALGAGLLGALTGKGPGGGGSIDLSKLISGLKSHFGGNGQSPFGVQDNPFGPVEPPGFGETPFPTQDAPYGPEDPNAAAYQAYLDWLDSQGMGGGGSGGGGLGSEDQTEWPDGWGE